MWGGGRLASYLEKHVMGVLVHVRVKVMWKKNEW